ncbi:MAG: LegC family aminotransferase [Eubacteriales bacterium]|nr:LegC family aminotransferase [Eubacteriales bacterium]
MNDFIPLSVPNLKGNESSYALNAINAEWVSTGGYYINEFEQKLSEYVKVPKSAACQSGTAGLHLSLLACGVEPEDEVIVPTLTFIAAVNPVRYVGAEPIFMDCDDTLCMDMDKLESFIETQCKVKNGKLINSKSGKTVRAVIVVHVFGNMANIEKLMALSMHYHFKVIEDATEALGSYISEGPYKGKYAGTIGDIGVYSFNGNKIITTGGGGAVVSPHEQYIDTIRFLSTQAKTDSLYFVHDEIGYNYRMTNLQAAIGLGQLEQLENFIEIKTRNYHLYQEKGISLLPFRKDIRPNYWFYSYLSSKRDELIQFLTENNIQSRPVWKLIHTQKPYEKNCHWQISKSVEYWNTIVNIPCSTNLTENDVHTVAERIHEFENQ